MKFKGTHILSTSQFKRKDLERVCGLAKRMHRIATREVRCEVLRGYSLLELFFKESTRTVLSHAHGFQRLGGDANIIQNVQFSSMSKGETFEDTIRVMAAFCDVMVIRSAEKGDVKRAVRSVENARDLLKRPVIINAGDGDGEHPTQALLDIYSIYAEKGRVDGLTIALVGDLKHSRTVHSLVRLLPLYENMHIKLVSPRPLRLPKKLMLMLGRKLAQKHIRLTITEDFKSGIRDADVLYMIRLQDNLHKDPEKNRKYRDAYVLTKSLVERVCKRDVTILHPLPRTVEIATDVDDLPNAAYFRQSDRGPELRMALFLLAIGKDHKFV